MTGRSNTNSLSNATAFAELCWMVQQGEYTKVDMAKGTGLQDGTVCRWMKLLRRKNKRLAYVCDWRRTSLVGQWAAVWAWGDEPDVPRPKPMTQSEYSKRYRLQRINKTLAGVQSIQLTSKTLLKKEGAS